MIICNRELVKDNVDDVIVSEIDVDNCEQDISNADMLDFDTEMDNLSFYETTAWNKCHDLVYVKNEQALWSCIVGEIKTPLGALSNSIGQQGYGCEIWELKGQVLDSLNLKDAEYAVIKTCIKYPEVNNVTNIESYVSDKDGALFMSVTIDSIYGSFDGHLKIPRAFRSNKPWMSANKKFLS